ncbi:hypothetical protein SNOG_13329 [Parastagonospora nodorum SN15]|uniref:Uncharacterized protein n=1 Tax=Phaeosphaeria nodorum (strain SN15 / ATCC MYA-4574 / FGSC 10173) TaxID=321614 RepID=Q0U4I5_PHANO|nr:hypothetical protein SNOG_13329 [Parastagonospora nodorum SN15]EAT79213.1 hypothetical protein SNOG_13329 [Parastagonospora nodorum SN15]
MSAVLTMQIVHALFPSLGNTSSQTNKADTIVPSIRVQPAEDLELRPLLRTLSHRRSSSRRSSNDATMLPRVGLALIGRRSITVADVISCGNTRDSSSEVNGKAIDQKLNELRYNFQLLGEAGTQSAKRGNKQFAVVFCTLENVHCRLFRTRD